MPTGDAAGFADKHSTVRNCNFPLVVACGRLGKHNMEGRMTRRSLLRRAVQLVQMLLVVAISTTVLATEITVHAPVSNEIYTIQSNKVITVEEENETRAFIYHLELEKMIAKVSGADRGI